MIINPNRLNLYNHAHKHLKYNNYIVASYAAPPAPNHELTRNS